MARIKQACPGDCSRCELLASGEVEMIPCILDQIFQRTRKNEMVLNALIEQISSNNVIPKLADLGNEDNEQVNSK